MAGFANANDVPFLAICALVVALLTWGATLAAKRLMPKSSRTAIAIVGTAVVPCLLLGLAIAVLYLAPAGNSPDGPAMLFAGMLELSLLSLPISALTAVVTVATRR